VISHIIALASTRLTEEERAELARKVADKNKQTANNGRL
jgi:hypothetical protein